MWFLKFSLPVCFIGLIGGPALASDPFETLEKELDQIYGEVPQDKNKPKTKRKKPKSRSKDKTKPQSADKSKGTLEGNTEVKPKVQTQQPKEEEPQKPTLEDQTQALKELVTEKPDDLAAKQRLGLLYLKSKKYDDCIKLLRVEADRLPRKGLLILARAYDLKGDLTNMIKVLSVRAQNGKPDHILLTLLGNANRRAKIHTVAVQYFKSAIALKSNYMPAWEGLVQTFKDTENSYELTIVYNDFIKLNGPTDDALNNLCSLYAEGGFLDKAKDFCQEAIQRSPRKPENHIHLATTLINMGNIKQGRRIIEQSARQFKKSELVQWKAGELAEQQANISGAARFYAQGIRVNPQSARCHLGHARALFELEDYDGAYDSFFAACKLDKTDTQDFKTAERKLRAMGKSKLNAKYRSGVGKCLLKKPSQVVPSGKDEPVWEDL